MGEWVLNKLMSLNNKKHMLIGASLLRIALGCVILYNYTLLYHQRYFLWGSNGVTGSEPSLFSLYNFSPSTLYFDVIYHVGMIVSIAFLVGYKGRVTSILNFIFVWSLMQQNSLILDGGDNLSRIILLYLLFAKTTAYFSVDSYLKNKRKGIEKETIERPIGHFSLRNLVHNLAILACLTQVCMMYLSSGLHKASGELWTSGTAIYYILQVDEFSHPFFRNIIHSSELFIVLGTYMTIIVLISFPFLLFNRYTRYLAMLGVISMHSGIAVVMGLLSFSFIMIANQLLFLTDKEYKSLSSFVKHKYTNVSARIKKGRTPSPVSELSLSIRPIVVLYDGWCPFCTKSIKKFQQLDWFNRLEFLSFRDEKVVGFYALDREAVEQRIHSYQRSTGKMEDGIYSINRMCKNIPLLWVSVPFLSLSSRVGLGQKVYDWIASRRTIFPTGGCDEDRCKIPIKKGSGAS